MRIAVTGASGFVGRYVVAECAARDIPVVAIARRPFTGAAQPRVVTLAVDLHAPPSDLFAQLGKPDVLVHLAWEGLPHYRSLHHFERELPAQYRLLDGLVRAGLPALVAAGTCFEYGLQSGPLNEAMPALPANPYGFAKDALRRQLEFLQAQHPFAMTWARLFYLHGADQQQSLFGQLMSAARSDEKTFKMSYGEQLRDYLPVSEAARVLVDLAQHADDVGTVNVCSGVPVSVRSLVESWIAQNGWSIELERGAYPYSADEPLAFWGVREKLDRCLAAR